ncbi:MAG: hypothetical protein C5B44_02645 [Acidobacteria bacterium]|nr:MAG: hypothetical protein C5B44_02645 [Acidobacteriota bacterium]
MRDATAEVSEETSQTSRSNDSQSESAESIRHQATSDNHTDGQASTAVPAGTQHQTRKRTWRQRSTFTSRRTVFMWLAIVAALTLVSIVLARYLLNRDAQHSTNSEKTAADTTKEITLTPEQRSAVAVEEVQKHSVLTDVTAPGKIALNGNRVTPVLPQFSGRIVKLDAVVESTVKAGQVIGTIDTPDIVGIESDYLQASSAERSARTALDLARRTRERSERLATAEAIPQRDLEQAQADESRAADDLKRAESALAAARGRLQSAGMKEAEIERLSTGARAVNRLMPIVAPIPGTIIERKAGIGQVVQPGAGEPLFLIADLSTVWINADIYEDQLAHIHTGQSMKVTTPAYPSETFIARVDQMGSTIDPDKHTVAVRCVVSNPERRLKPGMFVSVILGGAAPQIVITIPSSAVITEGTQRSVFVEEAVGKYTKCNIETGNEIDGAIVVRSGLKEGQRVVVRGGLLISAVPAQ